MSDPVPDTWIYRVKSAVRELVKRVGGVVPASTIAGVGQAQISRWQSASTDDMITLRGVLALEAECGLPIVTEALAELHGRRLTDPQDVERAACLLSAIMRVMRGKGEFSAALSRAMEDHMLTPNEAAVVSGAVSALETELAHLKMILASVQANGAVSLQVGR